MSKKRVTLLIVCSFVVALAIASIFVFSNSKQKDSSEEKVSNTTKPEETSDKIAEAPKLPEAPVSFMGKKACDIFNQTLADTFVGQGATKIEPAMFQKDFATVTTCQYVKGTSDAIVKIHRYFNESSAKKYLDSVRNESFVVEQKKEFVVSVELKISAQRSEAKSKELMSEITKKL